MKRVAFHNLGCKVNSYELDVVQQKFVKAGYKIVPFDQMADIYVINTCTVTNIADRKSRQMLHRAKKRNPEAVVVALGCYVQTGADSVETDGSIDIAIGNNLKKDTVEILEQYLSERQSVGKETKPPQDGGYPGKKTAPTCEMHLLDIHHTAAYEDMLLEQGGEHTRAYIKIQDGCNQFCSYCVIPYARGRVRSRKAEEILKEIEALVQKGCREFVLTGIHISSYGQDEAESGAVKTGLQELLAAVHQIPGVERIRLGSLEPGIMTEAFVKTLASMEKLCPHFHLSLQSGCNATLKRMNRHYTTEQYRESVACLRRYFDHPAITTDVIVGFPGESEEEFETTRRFLEETGFFEMHIFPYSARKGTAAARMDAQVDGETKKRRSKILLELERQQSLAYRRHYIGRETEVLFEEIKEIAGRRCGVGHTADYVKAAAPSDRIKIGEMMRVTGREMLQEDILWCEVLPEQGQERNK